MKRHYGWGGPALLTVALALPLASCGTTHVTRIDEPIGPAPHARSFFDEGRLVVLTQVSTDERIADEGYATATMTRREPYTISDLDGRLLRQVYGESTDVAPEAVNLPAGDYLVRAKGLDGQLVELRARIVPGRTTEVVLDRSWSPPAADQRRALVRAPDGTVVGWRATAIGGGPRR
jgi:hypothetical protein